MVEILIWKAVLGLSLFGLAVMIPTTVQAFAEAMRDDTPAHLPTPHRAEEPPIRYPVAKLTGKEYRRILRETAAYKKAARRMRCPGS